MTIDILILLLFLLWVVTSLVLQSMVYIFLNLFVSLEHLVKSKSMTFISVRKTIGYNMIVMHACYVVNPLMTVYVPSLFDCTVMSRAQD